MPTKKRDHQAIENAKGSRRQANKIAALTVISFTLRSGRHETSSGARELDVHPRHPGEDSTCNAVHEFCVDRVVAKKDSDGANRPLVSMMEALFFAVLSA